MNQKEEARRIPPSDSPERREERRRVQSPADTDTALWHPAQGMDPRHTKVERFLKLGYSQGDILRVLESLRHDAQTNDILEELIKTCQTRSSSNQSPSTCSTSSCSTPSPKLVARGCSVPQPGPRAAPPRPAPDREPPAGFRAVVIDGSNVAMSHGDKKVFSCRGLELAVRWFWDKGLRDITVFVPLWRKEQPRAEAPITDQHILHELEKRKILVYTPSRCVNGKRVVCYDDRYIVKLAFDSDGIIVSNDNYRDLQTENPQWKKFIEERLLMYSFVNDKFMPPDDPLGRNGPAIDDFLKKKPWAPDNKQQHCPYGKKCTYGVKCKFYHPERANQSQLSVADELRAMSKPDRAKPFVLPPVPYQLEHALTHPHRYLSSTPPPSTEDPSHRASPSELVYQRDTGSPRNPPSTPGLRPCPSPDVDEAFGSLDSYMPRLYIQDRSQSSERLSYGYSSGVASCTHSHEDYFPPGSYHGNTRGGHPSGGYYPAQNGCDQTCNQCGYGHTHRPPRAPAGSSCPPLLPQNGGQFSEQQYLRQPPSHRQSHSLPEDPWGPFGGRAKTPTGEQRKSLRSQLSTLFPQSTVEHVMSVYPHVEDMSQLISLIQRYRTSHIAF